MSKTWLISDTHFSHKRILEFKMADGITPIRNFPDVHTMNKYMTEQWNSVVSPDDLVYHLGDFCMNHSAIHIAGQLNGRKILIRGNHDTGKLSDYLLYFKDVVSYHQLKTGDGRKVFLSHAPLHPMSLFGNTINVHGHIHEKVIMDEGSVMCMPEPDHRYINVSVERINYTPVDFNELFK